MADEEFVRGQRGGDGEEGKETAANGVPDHGNWRVGLGRGLVNTQLRMSVFDLSLCCCWKVRPALRPGVCSGRHEPLPTAGWLPWHGGMWERQACRKGESALQGSCTA